MVSSCLGLFVCVAIANAATLHETSLNHSADVDNRAFHLMRREQVKNDTVIQGSGVTAMVQTLGNSTKTVATSRPEQGRQLVAQLNQVEHNLQGLEKEEVKTGEEEKRFSIDDVEFSLLQAEKNAEDVQQRIVDRLQLDDVEFSLSQAETNAEDVQQRNSMQEQLVSSQSDRWTIPTKPGHPDFYLQRVPTQAYPGLEGDLLASTPESFAKIFAHTSHRLEKDSCSSCAVVGGASPLLKRDRPGHEIDEHDCVFRVNHGVSSFTPEEQPSVSGQKTSHYMFYCCWDDDERYRLSHKNAADWIFLPTWKDGTNWVISALQNGNMGHDLVVMDPRFVTQVKDMAGLSQKPLAGTLMVSVAMQICDSAVDLYGFDTSDALMYTAGTHRPIEDHEWIKYLDSKGAVKIH